MTNTTNVAIDQIISRLRTMKPEAHASFIGNQKMAEVLAIHERLVGEAKPKTPRPVLERRILTTLAATDPRNATREMDAPASHEAAPSTVETSKPKNAAQAKPEASSTKARDPRIPPPGSVLSRTDRHGTVRCQATVLEDGINYDGKFFKSVSAAAKAAADDLGLKNKTQDGYAFWHLKTLERTATNKTAKLEKAWTRFVSIANEMVAGSTNDTKSAVHSAIDTKAVALLAIADKVS